MIDGPIVWNVANVHDVRAVEDKQKSQIKEYRTIVELGLTTKS
jgi:hypothetical protein